MEEKKQESAEIIEMLQDIDKMALELAKSRRLIALAQAEKALAQSETAELSYKYTVLQIYRKYNLNNDDALNEDGKILRGGAKQ